jgi:hypothetical protein
VIFFKKLIGKIVGIGDVSKSGFPTLRVFFIESSINSV